MPQPLLSLSADERRELARGHGQPGYRGDQLGHWLHQRRADDFAAMRNLPAAWRQVLAVDRAPRALALRRHQAAADGLTEKWLLAAADGAAVETVLIREQHGRRRTVCLSCMAGCPLGCVFCATGRGGFVRELTPDEIIEQAYRADNALNAPTEAADAEGGKAAKGHAAGLSHVVFMGMGEPLLNLDPVLRAAAVFTDAGGLGLSGRRITISTVGIPEGLRRLAAAGVNYRLAWSLHAADQDLRAKLMPAARTWPLAELVPAMRRYAEDASRPVTVEYALIAGVNDGRAAARSLAGLLKGWGARMNLIPFNPVGGYEGRRPTAAGVEEFRRRLEDTGLSVTVRTEKGADIAAACGQLRAKADNGILP